MYVSIAIEIKTSRNIFIDSFAKISSGRISNKMEDKSSTLKVKDGIA
jgi:hypothetical protein